MPTPTIQQGRLITKRSAIPGVVPTVPAVDDIETFIATDIFKGELFYNIPDNILYTRSDTGIETVGGGTTYVYYTENTGIGTEEAKIEVTDGTFTSTESQTPTNWKVETVDGVGNTIEHFNEMGPTDFTIGLRQIPTGANPYITSGVRYASSYATSVFESTNNSEHVITPTQVVTTVTDGTNTSTQTITPTDITTTVTDGTNTSTQDITSTGINLNTDSLIVNSPIGITNNTLRYREGASTGAAGNYSHAEGSSVASGNYSHSEGFGTVASGRASQAGGFATTANFDGEMTRSGYSVNQSRIGIVDAYRQTTNATPTKIQFNVSGTPQNNYTFDSGSTFGFRYICTIRRTSDGDAYMFTGEGLVKNVAGTYTLVYFSTPSANGDAGLSGCVLACSISGGLTFDITGIAATLDWSIRLDYNLTI